MSLINGDTILIFGDLAFLIPIIPIVGAFIALFLGKFLDKKNHGNLVALASLASSLVLTIIVSGEVLLKLLFEDHVDLEFLNNNIIHERTIEWFSVGDFSLSLGILIDPLSVIISLMVAFVAFLVAVYSRSYMSHDGSPRYYAEISLFAAAMLGLCFSPNFIQLFLFWELMGVCSYLLIGYFYDKEVVPEGQPHPASASKKAFLTTKVGDVFLFIGIILVYLETVNAGVPTFNFRLIQHYLEEGLIHTDPTLFVVIAILIFGGAVGKSAQFPLHVWLPDAMAGPTTVSCLIHSATMVKAGIFLIARTNFIFEHDYLHGEGNAMLVVALIGGITAILSGTIALVQTDIKGILAYSTISQLGYMTIGLGVGGMAVAVFHIINHGIFKALLFLSAGSVIHGSGTQDIREMGGLQGKMPHTWKVMLIGSLSLAGIGNGFFSKDAIILHALYRYVESGNFLIMLVWLSSVITAFLTAFYIFRMWFLVFPGETRKPDHHAHESDSWMTVPLWSLAIVSLVLAGIYFVGNIPILNIGILPVFNMEHQFVAWLEPSVHLAIESTMIVITQLSSIIIAILGIGLAYMIYYPRSKAIVKFPKDEPAFMFEVSEPDGIAITQNSFRKITRAIKFSPPGRGIQRILEKGYYMDDFYLAFVKFVDTKYCASMYWIERNIFDGAVRFVGKVGFAICGASKWWDENVVDRLVRLTAQVSVAICGLAKTTDERVIDHGIIRGSARGVMKTGNYLRRIQTGVVENYALYTLVGAIIIVIVMIVVNGEIIP
ncbi:MAG: NADH-quinone oxidoreductase subunit 5 family protein [Candidatus Kariarchaeaceae archaeon]|jgi:NADH-quinone oxidoreductase subunit L